MSVEEFPITQRMVEIIEKGGGVRLIGCMFFKVRSSLFHSYGDVTIAGNDYKI